MLKDESKLPKCVLVIEQLFVDAGAPAGFFPNLFIGINRDEALLANPIKIIGRMRDVKMGTNGCIYVGVENPGYVFRLLPVVGYYVLKASLKHYYLFFC